MSDSDGKTLGPLADTAGQASDIKADRAGPLNPSSADTAAEGPLAFDAPLVNAQVLQSPGRLEVQLGPAPVARMVGLFWAAGCCYEIFLAWGMMSEARPELPLLLNLPLYLLLSGLGMLLASLVTASLNSRLLLTPERYELRHRALGFLNWQRVGATRLIRAWEYRSVSDKAGRSLPAALFQGYLFPLKIRKSNGTSHYLGLGAADGDKLLIRQRIRAFLKAPDAPPLAVDTPTASSPAAPLVASMQARVAPQLNSESLVKRGLILGGPAGALALMLAGLIKFQVLWSEAQKSGQLAAEPEFGQYLLQGLVGNLVMMFFNGAILGGLLGALIARMNQPRSRSALLGAGIGLIGAAMVYKITESMSANPLLPLGFALYFLLAVVGISWLVGQAGDDGVP